MGGYTRLVPDEDRFLWTKNQFEDMLGTALGGRIAEQLTFNEITTGASNDLVKELPRKCASNDKSVTALLQDLKQRGLLDDTLVIWAGEFGRTAYCQGKLTATSYGRDHHPRCFTAWMSGGGVRPGFSYGRTDDYSYNVVEKAVHVHDLQATVLHCLGMNHKQLTYPFQGRDVRLTDVAGNVVHDILV